MKPVMQTRFGNDGNCLAACIASILECPLETVPDATSLYRQGKNWIIALNHWLAENHSLWMVEAKYGQVNLWLPPSYHIIGGSSVREIEGGHAVVGYKGRMVHDPHPSKAGLSNIEDYVFFIKLINDQKTDLGRAA